MAAKWIAIGLAVVVAFGLGWNIGSDLKQSQWDAAVAEALEQAVKKEREDQQTADAVGAKAAAAAVKERVVYKTLVKEIPNYVESNCNLSGGFRVFHDAAATATVPDPSTSRADAAPVKAEDLASTIADNYESCRDNERRLGALQEIINKYNSK